MIRFFVPGVPQSQGSKSAFALSKKVDGKRVYTGKVAVSESATKDSAQRKKSWRASVADAARDQMDLPQISGRRPPLGGPIRLGLTFVMPRPQMPAKYWWRWLCAKRPDTGKLARAVEDSLTKIIYNDDGQIADERILKVYPSPRLPTVGVLIVVEEVSAEDEEATYGCEPVDSPLPLLCLPEPF